MNDQVLSWKKADLSSNFEPTPQSILPKQEQKNAPETEINAKSKINCDINCVSENRCYFLNFSH